MSGGTIMARTVRAAGRLFGQLDGLPEMVIRSLTAGRQVSPCCGNRIRCQ